LRKLLFLDIDGVLNSFQSAIMEHKYKKLRMNYPASMHFGKFCPLAQSNLKLIQDCVPELEIVISSSWRVDKTVRELQHLLGYDGVINATRVIGKTPIIGRPRGIEIQRWFDWHTSGRSTGAFAILDDDDDMHPYEDFLVQTDSYHGLMYRDAADVITILNGDDPVQTYGSELESKGERREEEETPGSEVPAESAVRDPEQERQDADLPGKYCPTEAGG